MGSPSGPTLADILMTAFEEEIVKPLISSNIIKFYSRYVDDTLVLIKPSDIEFVLDKFNSFHPQIQFIMNYSLITTTYIFSTLKLLQRAVQSTANQHKQDNTCTVGGKKKQPG